MAKWMFGFVLVLGIIVSHGVTASAQRSVVGYWKTGGLGMINEVNTVTGQTKNNRGQMLFYMFDGTNIFLNPSRDLWKNMYSCFPNSNRSQAKTPTKKSLEFGFKTDQYGKDFICLSDAGVETCYRHEKE